MADTKLTSLDDPAALAAAIEGLTDEQILALAVEAGIDETLQHALSTMAARFTPEKARGRRAIIEWAIDTPEGEKRHSLHVATDGCRHEAGPAGNPTVTLGLSIPTFVRLICGRLNGLQAYSDGTLRLTGDTVVAQLQQMWFDVDLSRAQLRISRPSQLRKLLEGRSDAEINAGVEVTGVDNALDLVFQGMVDHFLPAKAGRKSAIIQFSIRTEEGDKAYYLDVDGGRIRYSRGTHPRPKVTLMTRLPTFLRIVSGQLDGIKALMLGRLKIKGNVLLGRALQSWFDQRA